MRRKRRGWLEAPGRLAADGGAPAAVLCAREQWQRHERVRWGRRETARVQGSSKHPRHGASGEIVGSGGATCGSAVERERERAVGEKGEGTDKWASLVGEREGKGGERPAGPRPRKEKGGAEAGRLGRAGREEKGEKKIHFLFQIHFPNAFSN